MIYLDHAATTPVPRAVADTMYDVLRDQYANPSAQYRAGYDMRIQVEEWREVVAGALDCPASRLSRHGGRRVGDSRGLLAESAHRPPHRHDRRRAQRRIGDVKAITRGRLYRDTSPAAPRRFH